MLIHDGIERIDTSTQTEGSAPDDTDNVTSEAEVINQSSLASIQLPAISCVDGSDHAVQQLIPPPAFSLSSIVQQEVSCIRPQDSPGHGQNAAATVKLSEGFSQIDASQNVPVIPSSFQSIVQSAHTNTDPEELERTAEPSPSTLITASTQTENEAKSSFRFQVPVISIHPPLSNPPSPRTSVVLPPQTKSVSCQTDIKRTNMGSRSVGVQTERLPINTVLIRLRQKALLNSIRSQNEDPMEIGSRLLQDHYRSAAASASTTTAALEEEESLPPPRAPSRANRSGSLLGLRSDLQEFAFSNSSSANHDTTQPHSYNGQTAPSPRTDDYSSLPAFAPPALLPPFEPRSKPVESASSPSAEASGHASSSSPPSLFPAGLATIWSENLLPRAQEEEEEKSTTEGNDEDVSKAAFVDELPTSPGLKRTATRAKSNAKRPPQELIQAASRKKYDVFAYFLHPLFCNNHH